MPGTNAGTGHALTLKCSKCRSWGDKLEATGIQQKLSPAQRRYPENSRVLNYKAEYKCLVCNHRGWSRHRDMERLLKKKQREMHELLGLKP